MKVLTSILFVVALLAAAVHVGFDLGKAEIAEHEGLRVEVVGHEVWDYDLNGEVLGGYDV